ncbi:MAG TPA: hypothetical protein VI461_02905 [Chitinophagaceae bacterium]|nr:hypothetical protein [Chitinophagaceae bacterium]
MKKSRLLCIVFSLIISACGTSTTGSGGSWKLLGEQLVNLVVDHDEMLFTDTKDDFRKIQLHVSGGSVNIIDMKIHFDDGAVQNVALQEVIKAGAKSRIITLDGGLRHLAKITFWYNTVGFFSGKSKVAVWGSK